MPCKTCCLPTTVNMRFLAAFLVLSILVVADCTPCEPRLTYRCKHPLSRYERTSPNTTNAYYLAPVTYGNYKETCYENKGYEASNINELRKELPHYLANNEIQGTAFIVTTVRGNSVAKSRNRVKVQDFTPLGFKDIWVYPYSVYVMIEANRLSYKSTDPLKLYSIRYHYFMKSRVNRNSNYPVYYACKKRC